MYITALLLLVAAFPASAQQVLKSVEGTVNSATDGEPLIGVSVRVVGTTKGASTNMDGHFKLADVPQNATLQFSYIGCKTLKLHPSAKPMHVLLEDDAKAMSDVVVTGYGSSNKGNYTGAFTSVKAEDIMVAGVSDIDQMLQGVIPGMAVTQTTGMVGASAKMRVRGTSSLLGNQQPVWVVDGVVQRDPMPFNSDDNTKFSMDADDITRLAGSAISWLNPSDIESITVLKDASATAIYGSEAANGVIVVTTIKGSHQKMSINYSGDFTFGERPRYGLYNQMNSNQLMELGQEMYDQRISYPSSILNIGYGGLMQQYMNKEITQDQFNEQYRTMASRNTDWFGELFRTSFSHKHTVSLSGGNEWIQNRTSVGYSAENGESYGNSASNFTATSNTSISLFHDKLSIDVLLKGSSRQVDGYAYGVDPFTYAYSTSRCLPLYNEDGSLYYHQKWGDESTVYKGKNSYLYNILNEMNNTGAENETKTWGATLDLKWKILKWLQYQGLVSYSSSSTATKQYATENSFYIANIRGYDYGTLASSDPAFGYTRLPFGGLLETGNTTVTSLTVRNAFVFDQTWKKKHRLTAQLGVETNSVRTKGETVVRYGYLRDRGETFATLPYTYYDPTMQETYENTLAQGSMTMLNKVNNKLSTYMTAAYTFDDRYIINFSARMDASNRFGQDEKNKFAPTWSIGAKWRLANEPYMEWAAGWLNNFDVYASYGYQGNAIESISPYLIATDGGVSKYYNDYYLTIKSLPYADLGWEKTRSQNYGIDAAFLGGRISFTFNYYRKTTNVLSSRNIPLENGMENSIINGGDMTNNGYDLVVTVTPIRTKNWTWQLSANTSVTNNAVLNNQRVNTLSDYLSGSATVEGEPFSTLYAYDFKGLNQTDGTPEFNNLDVKGAETPLAYLVKVGKITPSFNGGLNTQLKYKNWSLYALFTIQWGGVNFLPNLYDTSSNYGIPTPEGNYSKDLIDRWRNPGDETLVPSIPSGNLYVDLPSTTQVESSEQNIYTMYNKSTARVAKTDFIRCRQISLSYEFDKKLIKKAFLTRLNLKFSMTNPFLWAFDSKWKGLDPETGNWPTRHTYSLSVQAGF